MKRALILGSLLLFVSGAATAQRVRTEVRVVGAHMDRLQWLVGNWVGRSGDKTVHLKIRSSKNGAALDYDCDIQSADGSPTLSVHGMYYWNPEDGNFGVTEVGDGVAVSQGSMRYIDSNTMEQVLTRHSTRGTYELRSHWRLNNGVIEFTGASRPKGSGEWTPAATIIYRRQGRSRSW